MITTYHGDCRAVLDTLPEKSVQMCVTSPPYYGLRKYGDDPREIGQEPIPDCLAWARGEPPCDGGCYVCALRAVFAGVWRVLRDDGLLFLNLGDSYARNGGTRGGGNREMLHMEGRQTRMTKVPDDCPPKKNLLGIPWRTALALQADGWVLRNDNIWSKANPMPESVQDRCTRAHEYIFMLAKGPWYYYDATAVAEPAHARDYPTWSERKADGEPMRRGDPGASGHVTKWTGLGGNGTTRNRRTVWSINTRPYVAAHYAVFPEALVEIPIRAGSSAQACEHCGAAWRRAVEREGQQPGRERNIGGRTDGLTAPAQWKNGQNPTTYRDLGFAPGCQCQNNTGSEASVVLDPFAGSGTTLRVSERLGRNAIGIELSQDYIEDHIEKRTNGVQREMFV